MTHIFFYVCPNGSLLHDHKMMYKLNHAAAYGMIGHILSKVYHIPVEKIRLIKKQNGRPVLLYPNNGLNLSISHSDMIAVSAISYNSIGIDIEKVAPLKTDIHNYSDFFSDEELAEIAASDYIAEKFAVMWTRKEAYLKCRGEGIEYLKKAPCSDSSTKTIMLNSPDEEKFSFSYCVDDDSVQLYRYNSNVNEKLLDIYDLITCSEVI